MACLQAFSEEEERKSFVFNPFDDEAVPPRQSKSRRRSSAATNSLRSSSGSSGFSLVDFDAARPSPSVSSHTQTSSLLRNTSLILEQSPSSAYFPNEPLAASPMEQSGAEKVLSAASSVHSANSIASGQIPLSKQPSTISFNSAAKTLPPVAGYRIPASGSATLSSFPIPQMCGPAFKDSTGHPVYVCSAILGDSVHPAKAGPHLSPAVRWSFHGEEKLHDGRYDLLPITADMKWIKASHGRVPEGYTPVQGGYEVDGRQLYHAIAKIGGVWIPGKTATHLGGGCFPWNWQEVRAEEGYRILCWLAPKYGAMSST